jgi:hypothetical protein
MQSGSSNGQIPGTTTPKPYSCLLSFILLFVDLTAGTVFRFDEFGVKVSSFSAGNACVVVRRLSAGQPDQRIPREVARLMAEEREVAPSFM